MRTLADYEFTREKGMFFEGVRAGWGDRKGYRHLWVDGKPKLEHRLIWERYNGSIPEGMEIHHIDGLSSALSNLKLVTRSEHEQLDQRQTNRSPTWRANISAGEMGKSKGPHPEPRLNGRWRARISFCLRRFSLGTYPTEEAAQARIDAARAFANTGPTLVEFQRWVRG